MDCPSEENLIRLKLDGILGVESLDFDIPNRKLIVFHDGQIAQIEKLLFELNLAAKKLSTEQTSQTEFKSSNQKNLLRAVFAINFAFFIIEMTTGLISKSMGLIADSLDMLADSIVYGLALLAIGRKCFNKKKQVARLAGYFQITLAVIGFIEVLRRFFAPERLPNFTTMITVSVFALIANGICLYLLQKSQGKEELHMKASIIFTSNDILINLGVIVAGLLVYWLDSSKPDLVIGTMIFALVIQGAIRILSLRK